MLADTQRRRANYHLMPSLLLRADAENMEATISLSATIIETFDEGAVLGIGGPECQRF
jgi:hypothetical protein